MLSKKKSLKQPHRKHETVCRSFSSWAFILMHFLSICVLLITFNLPLFVPSSSSFTSSLFSWCFPLLSFDSNNIRVSRCCKAILRMNNNKDKSLRSLLCFFLIGCIGKSHNFESVECDCIFNKSFISFHFHWDAFQLTRHFKSPSTARKKNHLNPIVMWESCLCAAHGAHVVVAWDLFRGTQAKLQAVIDRMAGVWTSFSHDSIHTDSSSDSSGMTWSNKNTINEHEKITFVAWMSESVQSHDESKTHRQKIIN